MCGINLVIDKTKSLGPEAVRRMVENTHHRGPDESMVKMIETHETNYHLGANRLKITDHSDAAAQPYFSNDQKYALLFNGEVYNFYELKNELLNNGVQFSSHSDTEVLLHWIRLFGSERIDELQGMFAFAFIDFETNLLLIARDRFGIKPLYYYQNEQYFIISSEIQPIVKSGLMAKKINEIQVSHYLQYKYVKAPETFFKNILEVMPGQVLTYEKDFLDRNSFLRKSEPEENTILKVDAVEDLIKESLLKQINASVPVGLLLSGGVDSTLLLALAKKEGFSIPSFSMINSRKDSSFGTEDYRYARQAAELFESEHHELEMDISILNDFDVFIRKMDQPIGDSSYLMTSEICKHASDSMRVLISGAGADELFGGYNRHWAFYKYLKYRKSLTTLMPSLTRLSSILPVGFSHPMRKHFRMIQKLIKTVDNNRGVTFQKFLAFNELNRVIAFDKNVFFDTDTNWMSWALNHDLKNYLVQDVLSLSDKASMLHGIELRVPYLSESLLNYTKRLNSEELVKKGRKWILKELLIKNGGKSFAGRPKEGFGMPLAKWLVDNRVKHLWEFTDNENHLLFNFLSNDLLQQLLKQQMQKQADHGPLLWSILTLAHWLNQNFE